MFQVSQTRRKLYKKIRRVGPSKTNITNSYIKYSKKRQFKIEILHNILETFLSSWVLKSDYLNRNHQTKQIKT